MHPDAGTLPLDLFAFGRGLAFAATLALIGACVFAALIPRWRDPLDDDRSLAARALGGAWRVAASAALLLLLAHAIRGYGEVRSFLDPIEPFTWDAARPVLFATTWGRGWLSQVAAAALALPLALLARRRPASGLALLGTATLAVVVTAPLTGHATEHPWGPELGIGLLALHVLGAGLWLGTLFSMLVAGLWTAGDRDAQAVARLVNSFSPVALAGAAMAVAAGSLLAVAYVGNLRALWGTTYGRTLLVKLVLLLATLALGGWNWRVLRPRLGSPAAAHRLTRSAGVELLIALCILAATAVLVALPAPAL